MNASAAIASILKAEGTEYLFCFPVNPLIDDCARLGIRPIVARTERALVEHLLHIDEVDWVNSLFLSCPFSAARIGQYNEFVYSFFKCLSEERLQYAEGWYDEHQRTTDAEDVTLGDWRVQRRCPHLKADLTRFGIVEGYGSENHREWLIEHAVAAMTHVTINERSIRHEVASNRFDLDALASDWSLKFETLLWGLELNPVPRYWAWRAA